MQSATNVSRLHLIVIFLRRNENSYLWNRNKKLLFDRLFFERFSKIEIKVLKKLKLITNYFNCLFLTKQISLKKLISRYQQFSSNRKTKLVLLFFQENKKKEILSGTG